MHFFCVQIYCPLIIQNCSIWMCVYLLPCHFKHNRNNAWKGKNNKIKKCATKFQFSCTNMYMYNSMDGTENGPCSRELRIFCPVNIPYKAVLVYYKCVHSFSCDSPLSFEVGEKKLNIT